MSSRLWQYLIENDVDSFRQYVANATYSNTSRSVASATATNNALKVGSPSSLATSPRTPLKSRKSSGYAGHSGPALREGGPVITRADTNAKDASGRTILHHAASILSAEGTEFAAAVLTIPFLDLYVQDTESGWTALHRALYFGNVSIAHSLMIRDFQDATDYTISTSHANAGGLVKIKDHEGHSPFELFGLTIAPRSLRDAASGSAVSADEDSGHDMDFDEDGNERSRTKQVQPLIDLRGDEIFAFGSNKNLSLGVSDGDDRHFPEKITLPRPDHLLRRLHEDQVMQRQKAAIQEDLASSIASFAESDIPAIVQNSRILIQDVVMSKLHTAILTDDPISNLYICGFGPGGRLGLGDEATRFKYVCVQTGGLARRRVVAVALGQDHTIAICSRGEVYTWGTNKYGQLGYALPEVPANEVPLQLMPRQIYGLVKKERVIGAAASTIHSCIYTSSALYMFGKNEGQLGLTDADARSLEVQIIPRRVGVSVIQSPIVAVSAIDRATTVLLENHEVIVFTHYMYTRPVFQLETFTNYFLTDALATRYNTEMNRIKKITSGGNTICAMSSYGEVFTVDVPKRTEAVPSNVSTTNPGKARNTLPPPTRIWSIKKAHMAAEDVAVGQDGAVILCTASGSVWRKEKRANIKIVRQEASGAHRSKDYKFVRVPNLTRAVAIRSNAFGAFTAVRKDCDVTREQITGDPSTIWENLFPLLPFQAYGNDEEDEETVEPQLRFWRPSTKGPSPAHIRHAIITRETAETDIHHICKRFEPLSSSSYDMWIASNVTDVRIPIHSFLLKARSKVIRAALAEFEQNYYFTLPDVLAIEYGVDGQIHVRFQGADFLTIVNLVLYLYTDCIVDVWHHTSRALQSAARYRQVRTEVMKIAASLDMRQLERAARVMVEPARCLQEDLETALFDTDFFNDSDVIVELADADERPAHSALLSIRCPFFEGLFHGHAAGAWMLSRRAAAEEKSEAVRIDLRHMDVKVFDMVLRHLYADTDERLFDDVVSKDLDEFLEFVLEVMSAANELMLDRLAQICQKVLGRFVNTRNVCQLLNIVSECTVQEFKHAALEYICLNLENMLEQRLLSELDHGLMQELDEVVRQNQLAYMPFARSERFQLELHERHPELATNMEEGRQRRIDAMRLRTRLVEDEETLSSSSRNRTGSYDRRGSSSLSQRILSTPGSEEQTPTPSPAIVAREGGDDMPFEMDDETTLGSPGLPEDMQSTSFNSKRAARQTAPSIGLPLPSTQQADVLPSTPDRSGSVPELRGVTPFPNIANGFQASGMPWRTASGQGVRSDFKDIMDQTSASKASNLTRAMRQSTPDVSTSATKMSQKERKRQQQQQKEQNVRSQPDIAEVVKAHGKAPSTSPWQKVAPHPKDAPVRPSLSVTAPREVESVVQHNLPRQTTTRSVSEQHKTVSEKNRSIPSPLMTPSPKPAQVQIQSIRHTPLPSRTGSSVDARTPMAAILAQQQTEKVAIKEAVAKRSLQEIQQEQEFQEWWDQESRRVQEEEAATAAGSRPKGGRGRGGRSRGSGRNKTEEVQTPRAARPVPDEAQAGPNGGERRDRGNGRRGRGY